MKNFETSNVNKKMKLYIPSYMPLWFKLFLLFFMIILCIVFFSLGFYFGFFFSIFLIFIALIKIVIPLKKRNKWLKETMENDGFIQNNEFSIGSAGRNSMLMVSNQKLNAFDSCVMRFLIFNCR